MGEPVDETLGQHTVMATYRLRTGSEPAFTEILAQHQPTLTRLGFIESSGVQVFRQQDAEGRVTFVELFTWKPGAAGRAHQHPEVAEIWETMTPLLEAHGGRPPMEFPHFATWSA